MGQRTAGDKMFEAYLAERGFEVPDHEPDLGVETRPDYLVTLDGPPMLPDEIERAVVAELL